MPKTDHDRVIALAGLMQAVDLVRSIALRGQIDADDFETCMTSLLQIDASSSADVYGGVARLRSGLRLLEQQLHNPRDKELTRYVVILLSLERTLARRKDLLNVISTGVGEITRNLAHFPVTHSNTVARFAELYLQTISTLSRRIMVSGAQIHLNNPENANRIRALLLAGIRATILWRQSGGARLSLLLRRNVLLRETRLLLAELD
ncbi:MAG: high frequency lysogenization protein HflD [Gammaproteobacteria bacterium]|nr:high frequency lysogenization protein HflD [Gammaproteobacteria bacterium]